MSTCAALIQKSKGSAKTTGAWTTLEDNEGRSMTYRIVGSDEFDPEKHWISLDAPMAKALLKKSLDDEVAVETPSGTKRFVIVGVRYGES